MFPATVLGNHISHIINLCAQEQMIRSYAGRVITLMADIHTVRDNSIVHYIRYAVGHKRCGLLYTPIASCSTRYPQPAITKLRAMLGNGAIFVDLSPETDSEGCSRLSVQSAPMPFKKTARLSFDLVFTVIGTSRYLSSLTATAFTEAVRGVKLKLHNEFLSLCHALGGYNHARAFVFGTIIT